MEQTLRIHFPFESCMSSVACDMEEVSSESLRKMHDKEEITPEASWTAVTKGKGKEVWRLETRRGNGDAGSHSLVERCGRRLRESGR